MFKLALWISFVLHVVITLLAIGAGANASRVPDARWLELPSSVNVEDRR